MASITIPTKELKTFSGLAADSLTVVVCSDGMTYSEIDPNDSGSPVPAFNRTTGVIYHDEDGNCIIVYVSPAQAEELDQYIKDHEDMIELE